MKSNDFGIQIPVCPPKLDDENLMLEITTAVTSARMKALDDEILAEIVRIAKEADITQLVVLDKKNVVEALTKASAKKVYTVHGYRTIKACPVCNHEVIYFSKYCDQCGQKLDWEDQ